MSLPLRLLLAALSAVLAWLAVMVPLPLSGRSLLQGAVFGALVLVPFLRSAQGRIGRAVLLVAGGMAIQLIAVHLAIRLFSLRPAITLDGLGVSSGVRLPFAVPAAAVTGALLVAALAQGVIPLRATGRLWALAAAAGLAGGLLLGFPQALPGGWLPGLVVWQALVCAALHFGGGQQARSP